MIQQMYSLVLEERQNNHYEVTSPEVPKFFADVYACFVDEALVKARAELSAWVARQRERGEHLPPGRGRGFVVYGDGVGKSDDAVLWSKADVRRITGLSRSTLDRRMREGKLKPIKVGRRVLFIPWQVRATLLGTSVKLSD